MTTYIIKRILLMIPTLLFVLLVSFVVLNVVPGSPASTQMGSQGTESSSSQSSQQSYRIFKEQFNLDKPVLFNTRPGLTEQPVRERLETIADAQRPACPKGGGGPANCLPPEEKPKSGQIIEARETIQTLCNASNTTVLFTGETGTVCRRSDSSRPTPKAR
ncbi:MAG: hypothetical protein ABEN55_04945 [Bradymonadaceae bacterium]